MGSCTICVHGNRASVEASLCRGMSYRALAKRYNVSVAAIGRHNRGHVSEALRDRLAARALGGGPEMSLAQLKASESDNLLSLLVAARARAADIADRARAVADLPGELGAEKQTLAVLVTTAKLLGELAGHTTVNQQNLIISPDYLRLRCALLKALSPPEFRAARLAVAAALRLVEVAPEPKAIEATPAIEVPSSSVEA
jgi:hypothetical protein